MLFAALRSRTFLSSVWASLAFLPMAAPEASRADQDFDGDGKSDILWRHPNDLALRTIWLMNGTSPTAAATYQVPRFVGIDPWNVRQGHADFNGDGKTDLVWEAYSALACFCYSSQWWLMDGLTVSQTTGPVAYRVTTATPDLDGDGKSDLVVAIQPAPYAASYRQFQLMDGLSMRDWVVYDGLDGWGIYFWADLDGDGKDDLVWRNNNSKAYAIWLMDGLAVKSSRAYDFPGWTIAEVADFDGDGRTDLLWRSDAGETAIWLMDGTEPIEAAVIFADPKWVATHTGDFDGDGRADLVWRHSDSGATAIWLMDGTTGKDARFIFLQPNWTVARIGDYNGDGKSDLAWEESFGTTAMWLMDGLDSIESSILSYSANYKLN